MTFVNVAESGVRYGAARCCRAAGLVFGDPNITFHLRKRPLPIRTTNNQCATGCLIDLDSTNGPSAAGKLEDKDIEASRGGKTARVAVFINVRNRVIFHSTQDWSRGECYSTHPSHPVLILFNLYTHHIPLLTDPSFLFANTVWSTSNGIANSC